MGEPTEECLRLEGRSVFRATAWEEVAQVGADGSLDVPQERRREIAQVAAEHFQGWVADRIPRAWRRLLEEEGFVH